MKRLVLTDMKDMDQSTQDMVKEKKGITVTTVDTVAVMHQSQLKLKPNRN